MLEYFDYVSSSRFSFNFAIFFTLTNLSIISYAELSKTSASISHKLQHLPYSPQGESAFLDEMHPTIAK